MRIDNSLEQKLLANIERHLFALQVILGQISVTLVGLVIFLIQPKSIKFAQIIITSGIVISMAAIACRDFKK